MTLAAAVSRGEHPVSVDHANPGHAAGATAARSLAEDGASVAEYATQFDYCRWRVIQ